MCREKQSGAGLSGCHAAPTLPDAAYRIMPLQLTCLIGFQLHVWLPDPSAKSMLHFVLDQKALQGQAWSCLGSHLSL